MSAPTPRELEVLRAAWRLHSCKLAASELGIQPATVRRTLWGLYRKLGVSCAAEAIADTQQFVDLRSCASTRRVSA
jgi:DNA-binding NarL/FixJ family response regulator